VANPNLQSVMPIIDVVCPSCNFTNKFKQKYQYHAGFSNVGFLYNDEGNLTLIWNSYDPDYQRIVGEVHPWTLSKRQQAKLEATLKPAPLGGVWSFKNVPRCSNCHEPIGQSITETIYYYVFPNSLELHHGGFIKIIR
jgi:hypothetical protein